MGEIKDAIDTIKDLKSEFTTAGVYSVKRSISASAMEGTANFPVLVDDSISLDDGILVSRAAEKKYASFLLTVLTMDPYMEVRKGETPTASNYLKKFHQNMRVKNSTKGHGINLSEFLNESYYDNDMDYNIMESEAYKMAYAVYEGVTNSVPQDKNILLNYTIESVTTQDTLNSRFYMGTPVKEARYSIDNNYVRGNVSGGIQANNNYNVNYNNSFDNVARANVNHADNIRMGDTNVTQGDVRVTQGSITNRMGDTVIHNHIDNSRVQPRQTVRDRGAQWKPLTDNDCKKANDLVPTLLHIRVYPIDRDTREELTPIDFIMGVKATLHPIPVSEIGRMVIAGMRNENFIFNFIRWTTGEIKFFKDFLFAVDNMKMDAKDSGNDVTGWRPALKRRRNQSRNRLHFSNKSIMPNATLVVTDDTIKYIKDTYGYDLSNELIVNRMMDVYFLLGFVTINTVNQRATFKFDGIDTTDTYTFDTLRRENQNDDKAFKNMMKMLGRSM